MIIDTMLKKRAYDKSDDPKRASARSIRKHEYEGKKPFTVAVTSSQTSDE